MFRQELLYRQISAAQLALVAVSGPLYGLELQYCFQPLVFLPTDFPQLKISLRSASLMCCLGEHSWRTVACSNRFFCGILFQIGNVVVSAQARDVVVDNEPLNVALLVTDFFG